jgi:2-dehydro-3-deoxyglucarate aldolase
METNGIRQSIAAERPAVGTAVFTGSPALVETLGGLGVDFAWIDLEHGAGSPYDAEQLAHLARAADTVETELMVRIPKPEPAMVRKVLDTGVRNVLVPRVETAAEVAQAVEAGHFDYEGAVGDRGMALARANNWGLEMEGYPEREDDTVLVGAMIENETAIDNLDDILAVPELGFVFIGPADLSVSVGRPLETGSEAVQGRIERIVRRCTEADVPVAGIAPDAAAASSMAAEGYQILVVDSDIEAIQDRVRDRLEQLDGTL